MIIGRIRPEAGLDFPIHDHAYNNQCIEPSLSKVRTEILVNIVCICTTKNTFS